MDFWLIGRSFAAAKANVAVIAKVLGRRWKVVELLGGADLGGLVVSMDLYHILAATLKLDHPPPDMLDRRVDAGHHGCSDWTKRGILPCPNDIPGLESRRDKYALEVNKEQRVI